MNILDKIFVLICLLVVLSCQTNKRDEVNESEVLTVNNEEDRLLPKDSDAIIKKALSLPVTEIITGETGYAMNGTKNLWYNSINSGSGKETVLLFSGLGTSSLEWSKWLLDGLVDNGYNVIRFDYRDVGRSDWSENNAYSLEDLGSDAIAVLDANNINSAHLIGHSMGGMVAQSVSINYPERTKSVTSISSTGYMTNPKMSQEPLNNFINFITRIYTTFTDWTSEENSLKIRLATIHYFRGTHKETSEKDALEYLNFDLYQRRMEKSGNPNSGNNHMAAVDISGSRLEDLKKIDTPYLVVHGKVDNFIPFEHALLYSSSIKNCETLWIEEMGHGMSILDSEIILSSLMPFLEGNS